MIKTVTVENYVGDRLAMSLTQPNESGFAIRRIDGLGPGVASINTSEVATQDGSSFTSARLPQRNIILDLAYFLDPSKHSSIEEIRRKSYRFFPIKQEVSLIIETETRTGVAFGRVESNEPDIFSSESGAQISIICPDPNFYSDFLRTGVFAGIMPTFKFEYQNIGHLPATKFGEYSQTPSGLLYNDGDGSVGADIVVRVMGPAKNINILNQDFYEALHINTDVVEAISGEALQSGDEIHISTISGRKNARLLRSGVWYNILNALGMSISWPIVRIGHNRFVLTAAEGIYNLLVTMSHKDIYLGM